MTLKRMALAAAVMAVVSGMSGADAQAQTPTEKLGRGLANTFLGVLEVPNQMINTFRENTGKQVVIKNDATVKAVFVGPVRGVREAVKRTSHGIWDTVTFMSPGPGGNNYQTRIRPEFITETYDY
jgi:putative exosortase-associated protein (TIGR04073 family)